MLTLFYPIIHVLFTGSFDTIQGCLSQLLSCAIMMLLNQVSPALTAPIYISRVAPPPRPVLKNSPALTVDAPFYISSGAHASARPDELACPDVNCSCLTLKEKSWKWLNCREIKVIFFCFLLKKDEMKNIREADLFFPSFLGRKLL